MIERGFEYYCFGRTMEAAKPQFLPIQVSSASRLSIGA
jgi:hypothetical protein